MISEINDEAEAKNAVISNNSIEDVLPSINMQEKCDLLKEILLENNDPKDEDINSDSAEDIDQPSDDLHAKYDLLEEILPENNDPKDEDINSDSAEDIDQPSDDLHARCDLLEEMCIINKNKKSEMKKMLHELKEQSVLDDDVINSLHKAFQHKDAFQTRLTFIITTAIDYIVDKIFSKKIIPKTEKFFKSTPNAIKKHEKLRNMRIRKKQEEWKKEGEVDQDFLKNTIKEDVLRR
ncbi:hypothetical protein GUI12_04225 [Anaplasmataceae bacterium AB001_6]|nr:hypothetical protein GUI12_04225 [Anaplasmataceae bacterium AB001_6]